MKVEKDFSEVVKVTADIKVIDSVGHVEHDDDKDITISELIESIVANLRANRATIHISVVGNFDTMFDE